MRDEGLAIRDLALEMRRVDLSEATAIRDEALEIRRMAMNATEAYVTCVFFAGVFMGAFMALILYLLYQYICIL